MTDRERIERLYRSARHVTSDIEDFIGEMSLKQKMELIGALMGFWCAEEDALHARADGRSWQDVAKGMMKP